MKQKLIYAFLLFILFGIKHECNGQGIIITMQDGSEESELLSAVRDLHFSNDTLFLTTNFEIAKSYELEALRRITFENLNRLKNISESTNNVFIYPNPVSSKLIFKNLNSHKQIVNIFRMDGTLITARQLDNEKSTIDVDDFAKGIYFIQINETTLKFIKL